jgi:hypothetical protein
MNCEERFGSKSIVTPSWVRLVESNDPCSDLIYVDLCLALYLIVDLSRIYFLKESASGTIYQFD